MVDSNSERRGYGSTLSPIYNTSAPVQKYGETYLSFFIGDPLGHDGYSFLSSRKEQAISPIGPLSILGISETTGNNGYYTANPNDINGHDTASDLARYSQANITQIILNPSTNINSGNYAQIIILRPSALTVLPTYIYKLRARDTGLSAPGYIEWLSFVISTSSYSGTVVGTLIDLTVLDKTVLPTTG